MYAISIYDLITGETHLACDPFGMKPLFYSLQTISDDVRLLASSDQRVIKDILPSVSLENSHALNFLRTSALYTSRSTFDSEISQVVPGEIITFCPSKGAISHRMSVSLDSLANKLSEVFSPGETSVAIRSCISRHLVADSPVSFSLT